MCAQVLVTTDTAQIGRPGSQPGLPLGHDMHVIIWRRLIVNKLKLHAATKSVHELAFAQPQAAI